MCCLPNSSQPTWHHCSKSCTDPTHQLNYKKTGTIWQSWSLAFQEPLKRPLTNHNPQPTIQKYPSSHNNGIPLGYLYNHTNPNQRLPARWSSFPLPHHHWHLIPHEEPPFPPNCLRRWVHNYLQSQHLTPTDHQHDTHKPTKTKLSHTVPTPTTQIELIQHNRILGKHLSTQTLQTKLHTQINKTTSPNKETIKPNTVCTNHKRIKRVLKCALHTPTNKQMINSLQNTTRLLDNAKYTST